MGYFVKNRGAGRSPTGTTIPLGSTDDRPAVPVDGLIRFNTLTSTMEYYNGTDWVSLVSPGNVSIIVDNFTGDNANLTFEMSQEEDTAEQLLVFVGGVYQTPITTYNIDQLDIIFTSAPPLNSSISVIHNIGTIA